IKEEQAANARYWKIPACCDDDDDYDSAITPVLSTEETENSLKIDLFLTPDDPMPPSIEDDDNDSKGDNLFLERLLHDDTIPLPDTLDFSNVVRVFLPFFTYP
nr:hypothetical protein [Tanacetum cinerariifolium]